MMDRNLNYNLLKKKFLKEDVTKVINAAIKETAMDRSSSRMADTMRVSGRTIRCMGLASSTMKMER
jgi:hypothetical protein